MPLSQFLFPHPEALLVVVPENPGAQASRQRWANAKGTRKGMGPTLSEARSHCGNWGKLRLTGHLHSAGLQGHPRK